MPEDPGRRVQRDTQQERPAVSVALSRAGVTNLRRIISIKDGGKAELFYATLDLFADLSPERAGVHMSRFSEVVEDLAVGLTRRPFADIESLAKRMAEEVVETQEALRAEVHIRAQSPIMKQTPVAHRPTEQVYTLVGIAAATRTRTRLLVGVEVNGLTVCPCAQDMVRGRSLDRLCENGYSEEEGERILSLLPIASHNQRGEGIVLVDSLKVLLTGQDEGVVREVGIGLDDQAQHLAHHILDEPRVAVRLVDDVELVRALEQLVDLGAHRSFDDVH